MSFQKISLSILSLAAVISIGFAPAQGGATPAIAVAVIVEGGGAGSGKAAPIGGQVMAQWLKLLSSTP